MTNSMILASGSKYRAELMKKAGLEFEACPANIDERVIEKPLVGTGLDPADIAQILAEAKAHEVSGRHPNKLVIGCDQTLSIEGVQFHKPANMTDARNHLLQFSGKSHQLDSAIVLVEAEKTIWRHTSVATLYVRQLSPEYIGRYLAKVGEAALSSVGAYQIEGLGLQLFERIDGDYFTIMGLPLLPLLAELRQMEIIDG